MALPAQPFSGDSFFADIRARMDGNRGIFAGADGDLRYVCLDTTFYRLEVFKRPPSLSFTDYVATFSPDVRVVTTAQEFGTSFTDYCLSGPCAVSPRGEIIISHAVTAGVPASTPKMRYFGQFDGRSQLAFAAGTGDPSTISVPATLNNAVGGLLPIVDKSSTPPAAALGAWWSEPSVTGKMIFGIHRAAEVVFVLAQVHRPSGPGVDLATVMSLLGRMGVDDAVMGDGSDSVGLIVDGTVEIRPMSGYGWLGYKNNSIPNGILFRLQPLRFSAGSLTVDPSTTDPNFQMSPAFVATDPQGSFALDSNGLDLTITSFGTAAGMNSANLANAFGVPLPLTLAASTTRFTSGARFTQYVGASTPSNACTAFLTIQPTATSDGIVMGTLTLPNSRGEIVLNASLQMAT